MRKRWVWWFGVLALCALGHVAIVVYQRTWTLDDYIKRHVNDDINYDYYEDVPAGVYGRSKRRLSATILRKIRDLMKGDTSKDESPQDKKLVIFWTSWFKQAWWVRVKGGVDLQAAHCPETRCAFTHDRRRREEAAAILFLSSEIDLSDLPFTRTPEQRWVWVHVEAPARDALPHDPERSTANSQQVNTTKHRLDNLFNWTMTYHPASNIMEPYGALMPRKGATLPLNGTLNATKIHYVLPPLRPALLDRKSSTFLSYINALDNGATLEEVMGPSWVPYVDRSTDGTRESWGAFLSRPQLVAWMSSHCSTKSRREDYVRQLQEHVFVHTFGTCGTLRYKGHYYDSCGRRESHREDRCWQDVLARKFLFYLAFENSLCDAYVTEKLWKPLVHGLVPVVLGGANYSQFLPPNSYINALEYEPHELAFLLRQLQASPRDYGRFHLWRGFWRATLRPPLCELCLKIHNDVEISSVTDIHGWWREVGQCRNPGSPTTLL